MIGYLYKITNLRNGKSYIGKTYRTVDIRLKEHFKDAQSPSTENRPLHKAIRKYGQESFTVETLGVYPEGILEQQEILAIGEYGTYSKGYNATLGGDGARWLTFSKEEVIEEYIRSESIAKTAKYFDCSTDSISLILKKENVPLIKSHGMNKKIVMIDDKEVIYFDSISNAARWLLKEGQTKTSDIHHIHKGISRVINGERKSYLKRSWEVV